MPGPIGKRDGERRRRNKDAVDTTVIDVAELISQPVEVPVADENWHPAILQLWESLQHSATATLYEPSDWATAYLACVAFDRQLKPVPIVTTDTDGNQEVKMHEVPIPGAALTSMLKWLQDLMATEGARRRLKIETERKNVREAAASAIAGGNVIPMTQRRTATFD